jgi:N-acetylglutamate synthase-like GNAT family acetyltransferase
VRPVVLTAAELEELSRGILAEGEPFSFRARGRSMEPFLREGDLLTVRPVAPEDLRVGDVAFFRAPGPRLVAHRIVGRRARNGRLVLTVRGDAGSGAAELVEGPDVLGRVESVTRGLLARRLDRGFWRRAGRCWAALSRAGLVGAMRLPRHAAAGLLRRLQAIAPYRAAARHLVGTRASFGLAEPGDAGELTRIYGSGAERTDGPSSGRPPAPAGGGRTLSETLVARIGTRVAGAALLTRYPEEAPGGAGWWVFGMVVRHRYRGTGLGEGLLRLAFERATAHGAAGLRLLVHEDAGPARELYRKAGFVPATLPGLSEALEEEARHQGRRRVLLCRPLSSDRPLTGGSASPCAPSPREAAPE